MTGKELTEYLLGCGTDNLKSRQVVVEMPDEKSRYTVNGVYYDNTGVIVIQIG